MRQVSYPLLLAAATWTATVVEPPGGAIAALINVTTTLDDNQTNGNCTLREALLAAGRDKAVDQCPAGAGADQIKLQAGLYELSLAGRDEEDGLAGDLDIRSDVEIRGAGTDDTVVDGGGLDRVFDIGAGASVVMIGLRIRGGDAQGRGGGARVTVGATLELRSARVAGNVATDSGGGIEVDDATLRLLESSVAHNEAIRGGGIYVRNGTVDIERSIVERNDGGHGGGLGLQSATATIGASLINHNDALESLLLGFGGGMAVIGGTVELTNSTITRNRADAGGGGLFADAGAMVTLNNVTLASNRADQGTLSAGSGGGIKTLGGAEVMLTNTLLAYNLQTADRLPQECEGALVSGGYNLIGIPSADCQIEGVSTGNLLGEDPLLQPLAQHNGTTRTRGLGPGSPAIDAGSPAAPGSGGDACEVEDQRGQARPVDGDGVSVARCDIGAYEARFIRVATTTDTAARSAASCSLRGAIVAANTDSPFGGCASGDGVDVVLVPEGTYRLALAGDDDGGLSGDLDILEDVEIQGVGEVEIDAGRLDRVFDIRNQAMVWIDDLQISGGLAPSGAGMRVDGELLLFDTTVSANESTGPGGGIELLASSSLWLESSAVAYNRAAGPGGGITAAEGTSVLILYSSVRGNQTLGSGGGISAAGPSSSSSVLSLYSWIADNRAAGNGGGLDLAAGTGYIGNTTISGNRAGGSGGGLQDGQLALRNVTVAFNTAATGGGVARATEDATVLLSNSIVARNYADRGGDPDCNGAVVSSGHNLLGTQSPGCLLLPAPSDVVGLDPLFGGLGLHGGATPSLRLLPGSPAREAGSPEPPGTTGSACELDDQRFVLRPAEGSVRCDIGAFEATPADDLLDDVIFSDRFESGGVDRWSRATPSP